MPGPSKHILIISKGLVHTLKNVNQGKNQCLSSWATGDFTHLVKTRDMRLVKDEGTGFTLLGCKVSTWMIRTLPTVGTLNFIVTMMPRLVYRHYRVRRYDCIIARDPVFSGLFGAVLSSLLRIPLIVEFNGNYASQVVWEDHKKSLVSRLKSGFAQSIIPFVCRRAKRIKLLYPGQADAYIDDADKFGVFHEYTPVSHVEEIRNDDYPVPAQDYVLFLGCPWRIKGVDVLIESFNSLCDDGTDYRLLIVGWFPGEEDELDEMVRCDRITITEAVDYPEALALIANCKLLVLPSRTEAMGRVLLEAMAFGKPVVGSDVDGIPHYIVDGKAGYIFECGDHAGLAGKISMLMNDEALRNELGEFGRKHVMDKLSEDVYSEEYKKMVIEACED